MTKTTMVIKFQLEKFFEIKTKLKTSMEEDFENDLR